MKLNQLRQWSRNTFHHYVVFKKSIFFIVGLIFSYNLVEMTFLNILITHLPDDDLRKAVALVSLQEGTSAILVTFFTYAADVYTSRFTMLVFSIPLSIIGMLLNMLAARNGDELQLGLFYPALALMTLAQAAQTVNLQVFLDDQLRPRKNSSANDVDEDDQSRPSSANYHDEGDQMDSSTNKKDDGASASSELWWIFVYIVAAILAQFGPLSILGMSQLALVLSAVMGGFFLLFLLGTKYYYNLVAKIEHPFKDVWVVIQGAVTTRKAEYPQTQSAYFQQTHQEKLFDMTSSIGRVHILPHVPWLRCLDKAAIRPGGRSSVEEVCRVKLLLKMLPLWSCFLTFSLVVASGSSFFLEEAESLADDIRPIVFFTNLQRLTEFAVSVISSFVISKLGESTQKYKKQNMELVRIGIGMSCCVLCCIAASATATRRQHDKDDHKMNVYLLTPQFLLLGLMAGLSQGGLESFYETQVQESLSTYGAPSVEFIMGVGKFLSIFCILIFSTTLFKWFASELEQSRLSNYYILLAVWSVGNFIIYCLVALRYGDNASLLKHAVHDDIEESINKIAHQADHDQLEDDACASLSNEEQPISVPSPSHQVELPDDDGLASPSNEEQPISVPSPSHQAELPDDGLSSPSNEEQPISVPSLPHEADQLLHDGIASRSNKGQYISLPSLSRRTASRPNTGDVIIEISDSSSKQGGEEEETADEEQISATSNTTYNYLLRLQEVILRVVAARRRSKSNLIIKTE